MNKKVTNFLLDLTDFWWLRRLGLERVNKPGGGLHYTLTEDGPQGMVVVSIEEAAYLIVGLAYSPYNQDASGKDFYGDDRLGYFIDRKGPEVYIQLCGDLGSSRLPELTFPALLKWIDDPINKRYVKYFTETMHKQFQQVIACISEAKTQEIVSVRGQVMAQDAYEEVYGKSFVDPKRKKGRLSNQIKYQTVFPLVQKHLHNNPNSSVGEFLKSKNLQSELKKIPAKDRPLESTIRSWVKYKFNPKPGRPKGT